MLYEKDQPIPMDDGVVLRANVFRPEGEGRFPVVMAQGIYGKDVHFADGFPTQFKRLLAAYPGLCSDGSTGRFLRWETVDPERWVPDGYVVVQIDSRGAGMSPGYLDPRSPREISDYYQAIEWAGVQPWSNGRVGLIGVSYLAFTQWSVAALQPPHLAAIVPWEGLVDSYRCFTHHGGILANGFVDGWWPRQVTVIQHGNAQSTYRDRDTDGPPTGPALSPAMLAGNRSDYPADLLRHPLDDAWHRERTPDLSRVRVPVLSAANWGGPGMHLRGNFEGFLLAGSPEKWLSTHVGTHWESFYLPEYVAMQKRFFDHFLKGLDNGWDAVPRVQLGVRQADGTVQHRDETEFPLARTRYVPYLLDAAEGVLSPAAPNRGAEISFGASSGGVDFTTAPFEHEMEVTGFVTLRLWVSSSTDDMDIFASLHLIDPAGAEMVFDGAHEPTPLARGWLRASHRKLDPERTLPFRVFHAHDETQLLTPGELYPVEIEIWPTSIVLRPGYVLLLRVRGSDFQYPDVPGRLLHNDARDRPSHRFGGRGTIVTGPDHPSALVLPVIPVRA